MLELASRRPEYKHKQLLYHPERARQAELALRKTLHHSLNTILPEEGPEMHLFSQKLIQSVQDPEGMLQMVPANELERRERWLFSLLAAVITTIVVEVSDEIVDAVVDAANEAIDWVEEAAEKFVTFVNDVATAIDKMVKGVDELFKNFGKDLQEIIKLMAVLKGDCPIDKDKIGASFGDKGPTGMKSAMEEQKMSWGSLRKLVGRLKEGKTIKAKEEIRMVAGSACGIIWDAIETVFPSVTTVVSTLKHMQQNCKSVKENEWKNAAITIGATVGAGLEAGAGVAVSAGIGLEVGLGMSMGGQQICYVGGCVSAAVGAAAKAGFSASIDIGVAITLFKDASSIPGTCQTVGVSGDFAFVAGVGGEIDFAC